MAGQAQAFLSLCRLAPAALTFAIPARTLTHTHIQKCLQPPCPDALTRLSGRTDSISSISLP